MCEMIHNGEKRSLALSSARQRGFFPVLIERHSSAFEARAKLGLQGEKERWEGGTRRARCAVVQYV